MWWDSITISPDGPMAHWTARHASEFRHLRSHLHLARAIPARATRISGKARISWELLASLVASGRFDLSRRVWDSLRRSFERFGALTCRGRATRLDAQGAGSRLALRYRSWQAGPREPARRPERLRLCAALGPGLRSRPVAEVCFTALTDGAVHALAARPLEAKTWPSMHAN